MALGYQHFFMWVLLAAIPVTVMSQLIPMTPSQRNAEVAAPQAVAAG
jgi:PAT family beta-lactamase induction signal transducer AmpG